MNHLLERFRDGRIAIADFTQLKQWLESDIDAPRKRNSLGRRTRRTDRNEWPYLVKEYRKSATRRV
jgi:hypothetical protein